MWQGYLRWVVRSAAPAQAQAMTTELTGPEKVAGRRFRDWQCGLLAESLAADPPDLAPSLWNAHIRHNCAARDGRSTSFRMHEVYVLSPAYAVCSCGETVAASEEGSHHPVTGCQRTEVPAGRFAFFYKEGKCSCGLTGRSLLGQFVIAADRSPAGKS